MPRKLSLRGFQRKAQQELVKRPELLGEFFDALERKLKKDDSKAIDLAAEIFGYRKTGGGGIHLTQQLLNANRSGAAAADVDLARRPQSLESILANIEAGDRQRALPAGSQTIDVKPSAD